MTNNSRTGYQWSKLVETLFVESLNDLSTGSVLKLLSWPLLEEYCPSWCNCKSFRPHDLQCSPIRNNEITNSNESFGMKSSCQHRNIEFGSTGLVGFAAYFLFSHIGTHAGCLDACRYTEVYLQIPRPTVHWSSGWLAMRQVHDRVQRIAPLGWAEDALKILGTRNSPALDRAARTSSSPLYRRLTSSLANPNPYDNALLEVI